MPELIDLERIVVDNPSAAQITADRLRRHLECGRFDQQPPSEIHYRVHRDDLDHWKDVALVAAIILRRLGSHGRARRTCGAQRAREHGAKSATVGQGHGWEVHRACQARDGPDGLVASAFRSDRRPTVASAAEHLRVAATATIVRRRGRPLMRALAHEPQARVLDIHVIDGRDVERQELRHQQPADHRETERAA